MQSVTQHPTVRSAPPESEPPEPEPPETAPNVDVPKLRPPPPAKVADGRSSEAGLRAELGQLIDQLSPLQQRCLRARWVDTVLWMEDRASHGRNRYCLLRLLIICGGVLIPALISLELAGNGALVLK